MTRTSTFDLPYLIRRAGRQFPGSRVVDDGRRKLDLGTVVERGERFANALDGLGIPEGAGIGVLMENRSEYLEADVGIALARRVRVALNVRLSVADLEYMARDSGIVALIHSRQFAEEAHAVAQATGITPLGVDEALEGGHLIDDLVAKAASARTVRPGTEEDAAWITYTSGTTGAPKGVVLSHRSIREVAFNLLLELGPVKPGDKIVLPQPVSHGAGYFVLPYLLCGATLRLMERFDPQEVLALGDGAGATLKVVPAMFDPLLEAAGERARGFDSIVYGAAPISAPTLEAALECFGPRLIQIYGQSEAPVTITCLRKEDHEGSGEERFSAGRPWRTVAVEVWDEYGKPVAPGETGEVAVSGAQLMTGYHNLPEASGAVMQDGWIRTRDMGVQDERGYLYLKGRSDEMINSGGFNISPREVERVLAAHPAVDEVAVVGLPDERWGHAVNAVVRARPDAALTEKELIEFAKPQLGFRTPKGITMVGEIPKTAYGKIDREQVMRSLDGDSP